MAEMKLDLQRLGEIGEQLEDPKALQRVYNFLYQLSEQLRYWQNQIEPDNLSDAAKEEYDLLVKRARLTLEATEQLTLVVNGIQEDGVDKVQNNTITIDTEGIKMAAGLIRMLAGLFQVAADDDASYIRFGGTEANPNFLLGIGGDVIANAGSFQSLSVAGEDISGSAVANCQIIVADSKPDGSNILWVKPTTQSQQSSETDVTYTMKENLEGVSVRGGSATITNSRPGAITGTVGYIFSFGIINNGSNYSSGSYVRVTLTGEDENGNEATVTGTTTNQNSTSLAPGSMQRISVSISGGTNVMYGGTVALSLASDFGTSTKVLGNTVITCTGTAGSGETPTGTVLDCEIKYIT